MSYLSKQQAILFDLYGTLIDIWTDEYDSQVWNKLSSFLKYQDIILDENVFRENYFEIVDRNIKENKEEFPEINVPKIFKEILSGTGYKRPKYFYTEISQLFRVLSMRRFRLFDDTMDLLTYLNSSFKLGIISDAQYIFSNPEMKMTGLFDFMDVIIISSNYGFRKPDKRLFQTAVNELSLPVENIIYVGNSVSRDVCGARNIGMKAVLVDRGSDLTTDNINCEPTLVVRSLSELKDWVKNQNYF